MTLVCAPRQTQILGLELAGGASQSIFPRVEAVLNRFSGRQESVCALKSCPDSGQFRSFIDFLTVSVCPEIEPLCLAFYEDEGPPLRDQITHFGRDCLEVLLLAAIEASWICFQNNYTMNWGRVRRLLRTLELPPICLYPESNGEE